MTATAAVRSTHRAAKGLVLAVIATLVLGGCGSGEEAEEADGGRSTAVAEATPVDATIVINDFTYSPIPLDVQAGASITVENNDDTAHTLTADDGSFDTGTIEGGASAELDVTGTGPIEYHCEIHPSMKGVIKITSPVDIDHSEPQETDPGPAPGY